MNTECLLLFPWLIQFTMLEEESINTRMHTQQQSNKLCKAFASFLVLQSTLNLISSSLALTWEMFQSWLFCCNAHLSRSPPMQQQPPEAPGWEGKGWEGHCSSCLSGSHVHWIPLNLSARLAWTREEGRGQSALTPCAQTYPFGKNISVSGIPFVLSLISDWTCRILKQDTRIANPS